MAAGKIDGFCAGAPWGEVAARAGLGHAVATSHAIWNNGTEKVFAVRQVLAVQSASRVQAALRALLRAARYCDMPANARGIAALLSQEKYLGLPAEIIQTSLPGAASRRPAGSVANADESVFFANAANFPWRSHAQWFLREMKRWGYLGADAELAIATAIFRPELYALAARSLGLAVAGAGGKSGGQPARRWLPPAVAAPLPIG